MPNITFGDSSVESVIESIPTLSVDDETGYVFNNGTLLQDGCNVPVHISDFGGSLLLSEYGFTVTDDGRVQNQDGILTEMSAEPADKEALVYYETDDDLSHAILRDGEKAANRFNLLQHPE